MALLYLILIIIFLNILVAVLSSPIGIFLAIIAILGLFVAIISSPLGLSLAMLTVFGAIIYFSFLPIYEFFYYKSKKFLRIKSSISENTQKCNELNEHIEELKSAYINNETSDYGKSSYNDLSIYNYKRPELKLLNINNNTYNCSLSVCKNAQQQPFKYLCKYFNFEASEDVLSKIENTLNDFSAAEQGKILLSQEREEILSSIKNDVPFLIMKYRKNNLIKQLGFENIDFSENYFPKYSFRYISPAGNSSMSCDVLLDIDNLERFVTYLSKIINFKNSALGQRCLMTTSLREKIKQRDNYTCRNCGLSIHDEPNLLLEIDHIVPISKGGLTQESNLQTLCWKCNRHKGNKLFNAELNNDKLEQQSESNESNDKLVNYPIVINPSQTIACDIKSNKIKNHITQELAIKKSNNIVKLKEKPIRPKQKKYPSEPQKGLLNNYPYHIQLIYALGYCTLFSIVFFILALIYALNIHTTNENVLIILFVIGILLYLPHKCAKKIISKIEQKYFTEKLNIFYEKKHEQWKLKCKQIEQENEENQKKWMKICKQIDNENKKIKKSNIENLDYSRNFPKNQNKHTNKIINNKKTEKNIITQNISPGVKLANWETMEKENLIINYLNMSKEFNNKYTTLLKKITPLLEKQTNMLKKSSNTEWYILKYFNVIKDLLNLKQDIFYLIYNQAINELNFLKTYTTHKNLTNEDIIETQEIIENLQDHLDNLEECIEEFDNNYEAEFNEISPKEWNELVKKRNKMEKQYEHIRALIDNVIY